MKRKNKKICLFLAGGTAIDEKGFKENPVKKSEDVSFWLSQIPELSLLADIQPFFICAGEKDLSGVKLWQKVSRLIYKKYQEFDGFIGLFEPQAILFNGIALSFALENLGKPIILTGSQISEEIIKEREWLGKKDKLPGGFGVKSNLINAIQLATMAFPGVGIIFGNRCVRPVKAIRAPRGSLNIFSSIDNSYLAKIDFGISPLEKIELPKEKLLLRDKFSSSEILVLKYSPRLSFKLVESLVKGYSGLIMESVGDEPLPKTFIVNLATLKIPIIIYNRLGVPRLNKKNLIEVSNLTLATTLIKFQWALGQVENLEELRNIIYCEYCWELINYQPEKSL